MFNNFNLQVAAIVKHADVNPTNKHQEGIDTTNPPILHPYDL